MRGQQGVKITSAEGGADDVFTPTYRTSVNDPVDQYVAYTAVGESQVRGSQPDDGSAQAASNATQVFCAVALIFTWWRLHRGQRTRHLESNGSCIEFILVN